MMPSPSLAFAYDMSPNENQPDPFRPIASQGKKSGPPRLKALSIRKKALRQLKPMPKPFLDLPPTLADTVCFAALEANEGRPNKPFTISSAEWPELRTEASWSAVVQGAMLFLVDLAVEDRPHLEVALKTEEGRTDLLLNLMNLTLPSEGEFESQKLAQALQSLGKLEGNAQLILDYPRVALRLPIPAHSA